MVRTAVMDLSVPEDEARALLRQLQSLTRRTAEEPQLPAASQPPVRRAVSRSLPPVGPPPRPSSGSARWDSIAPSMHPAGPYPRHRLQPLVEPEPRLAPPAPQHAPLPYLPSVPRQSLTPMPPAAPRGSNYSTIRQASIRRLATSVAPSAPPAPVSPARPQHGMSILRDLVGRPAVLHCRDLHTRRDGSSLGCMQLSHIRPTWHRRGLPAPPRCGSPPKRPRPWRHRSSPAKRCGGWRAPSGRPSLWTEGTVSPMCSRCTTCTSSLQHRSRATWPLWTSTSMVCPRPRAGRFLARRCGLNRPRGHSCRCLVACRFGLDPGELQDRGRALHGQPRQLCLGDRCIPLHHLLQPQGRSKALLVCFPRVAPIHKAVYAADCILQLRSRRDMRVLCARPHGAQRRGSS